MLKELIICRCPSCRDEAAAPPECAGQEHTCSRCKTGYTIPVGLTPRLVPVIDSPGIPLTPEEEAAVRREMEQRRAKPSLAALIVQQCRKVLAVALVALRDYRQRF